jgi:hypothetical protein
VASILVMQRFFFLLLLLGFDWYFDTSFGTSPFTRPMYSTEVICNSLACKHDINVKIDLLPLISYASVVVNRVRTQLPSPTLLQSNSSHFFSDSSLTYLLMSMQC